MLMSIIRAFEIFPVDIPFKNPFRHAAADRTSSCSIMLKCITSSGQIGFGECLPREYVTGESRQATVELLTGEILPRLVGQDFSSMNNLLSFLHECDGKAPAGWLAPDTPQTAAWAAVDLALLDAFGHEFNQPVAIGDARELDPNFRYSAVFSADSGIKAITSLIKFRLFGFRQIKLKVENAAAEETARLSRKIMGSNCDIRADANMAWTLPQATAIMKQLAKYGIRSFEQPLKADDLQGAAQLIRDTQLNVMADESLHDSGSLERLIRDQACTAVNVRISKCGGLVAAHKRAKRALESGLTLQVGCQVGETSLLSAAQLILIAAVRNVTYGEGCFGLHLLREDPVRPIKQFGYGGRPPSLPAGPGLGVQVDEKLLNNWCREKQIIS